MKKIAVISDIHANIYALNEFLSYIEKNSIDIILNLGDFVQIGPNPYEVSNIILNDKRFINILGNNETSLFDIDIEKNEEENNHRKWTKEALIDNLERIKEFPNNRVVKLENLNILMVHSRLNEDGFPLLYNQGIEAFYCDYKEVQADVVMFGHTHEKLFIEYNKMKYINPGSLGCSKELTVDFATMSIEGAKIINFQFHSLKYNKTKLLNEYNIKNIPDSNFIKDTFFAEY